MALVFDFAARSDVGRVRAKNDDSAYVGRRLAVVADGMGGHVGGDVASASTVLDLAPLDRANHPDPTTVLADEIQNANLILNDLVNSNPKLAGMGTTCTGVLLDQTTLHMAHIGDSRAYRLKDGEFSQISKDHTFVQRLVDEGRLKASEAESHPHKNVLMRVLGDVDASPELDLSSHEAAPGERWLLCSDGLNAVVADSIIEEKLRHGESLQATVDELVEITLAGGAPDNVTIIVFEIIDDDDEDSHHGETPTLSETARAAASTPPEASVSAALLREELNTRPHLLVGAAQLATHTDQIPIVTRASTEKRAAALLHTADEDAPTTSGVTTSTGGGTESRSELSATQATGGTSSGTGTAPARPTATGARDGSGASSGSDDSSHDSGSDRPRKALSWPLVAVAGVLAVLFAGALVAGYLWTQTQYYVGADNGRVAIYQGVSQNLGPITLSSVESTTEIPLERLPAYNRRRVESGLPAQDINHALEIINDLEENLTPEAPPLATPSPEPTDNPDATAEPLEITMVPGTTSGVSIGGAAAGAIGGSS